MTIHFAIYFIFFYIQVPLKSKETQQISVQSTTTFPHGDKSQLLSTEATAASEHGGDGHHEVERYPVNTVDFERVETPFLIGIWILFASVAKIVFHMTPKVHKVLPESSLLIVVGVIVGLILYTSTKIHVSPLTPTTFFFYMLPPIILGKLKIGKIEINGFKLISILLSLTHLHSDAGYFMPNRLFFDNLGTILLMAVVGTIWNMSTIGKMMTIHIFSVD